MCFGNSSATPVGFKVGDKVRVVRRATTRSNGWKNAWVEAMDKAIGQTGVVTSVYEDDQDVSIKIPGIDNNYGYPPFSLELVKDGQVPSATQIIIVQPETKLGFTVGQRVTNMYGKSGTVVGFSNDHSNQYVDVMLDGYGHKTGWFTTSLTPVTVGPTHTVVPTPVEVAPVVPVTIRKTPAGVVVSPFAALKTARDLAVKLARQNPAKTVTIDWVQDELVKMGYKSTDLGNAAGVIFKGGQFRNTGMTAKSIRPGNNHRRITVWEYIGEGPVTGRFIVESRFSDGWDRSGNPARTISGHPGLDTYVFSNLESATEEARSQQQDQGREYRAVSLA